MYSAAYKNRAQHYTEVHNVGGMGEDSPHRLIQMLMEGFLARINSAKGAMAHGDLEAKSVFISRAIGIIGGLNEALDLEQGGDLAINLHQLYGYMNTQLVRASYENSEAKLDEVAALMRDIKEAWDAIA